MARTSTARPTPQRAKQPTHTSREYCLHSAHPGRRVAPRRHRARRTGTAVQHADWSQRVEAPGRSQCRTATAPIAGLCAPARAGNCIEFTQIFWCRTG
ncbi:uncharacterized protein OE_1234R [Halobacterium salinarum R1]|uniref:Uncharacterized protein n=3 Tax=Halobacterium salinarum TaxID=2242 RepID=A0A510N416_HALSA|nr:uncharacterized protein HBSAL_01565 [Halobacterium salinarum]CAP13022.1 uncharacterized protein OE_1234R [Halobacterium salinarum R1]DAC77450.1 TPA_inf: uncharacterized protein VNG_0143H [Halobacterium salinarum NRC-1]